MRKYVFTARARLDLLRIVNHIAENNIGAADKRKIDFRQAMVRLADMPGMGHRRADVKNPRDRFWSVYSYLIAYFPDTKPLKIVRIVHGAQNIARIFRQN